MHKLNNAVLSLLSLVLGLRSRTESSNLCTQCPRNAEKTLSKSYGTLLTQAIRFYFNLLGANMRQ